MQGIRYLGIPFSLYKRNKAECNPRKNEGAATAQVLKILVSVVRFRPGPPRIYLAQRPLMQVGVFVCQTKSLCVRCIPGFVANHKNLQPLRTLHFSRVATQTNEHREASSSSCTPADSALRCCSRCRGARQTRTYSRLSKLTFRNLC